MSKNNSKKAEPSLPKQNNSEHNQIFADIENNKQALNKEEISWNEIFKKSHSYIKEVFLLKFKKHRKEELRLLDQVNILITESDAPDKVTDTCEKYIALHRIVENTKARGRLERWITKLIAWYLFAVFIIVALVALSHEDSSSGLKNLFKLSDTVMITILSTTTVNIVALGIILVRGLFHENERHDLSKEKPSENKNKETN